ncbi:MAG TPA: hypothetical protein PLB52_04370 [Candidatus Moranbacteria bacterium]|nr:hypothetical protein [Candidatus Moranbacteria bacterium]
MKILWLAVLAIFACGNSIAQADKAFSINDISSGASATKNRRSADPCGKLVEWQNEIVSPELWNGQAEHKYSPAAYIVFSAKENTFNLVSVLVMLELSQKLITTGTAWNSDFERRLLEAVSYGSRQNDWKRWPGFVPQCVGMTYQFFKEKNEGLTFREAFEKYTGNQEKWENFQLLYSYYAFLMNQYLGTHNLLVSDSDGYYDDFQVTPEKQKRFIFAVQRFLEAMNSPLKNKNLFKEQGLPSIISYDAPDFCQ